MSICAHNKTGIEDIYCSANALVWWGFSQPSKHQYVKALQATMTKREKLLVSINRQSPELLFHT